MQPSSTNEPKTLKFLFSVFLITMLFSHLSVKRERRELALMSKDIEPELAAARQTSKSPERLHGVDREGRCDDSQHLFLLRTMK